MKHLMQNSGKIFKRHVYLSSYTGFLSHITNLPPYLALHNIHHQHNVHSFEDLHLFHKWYYSPFRSLHHYRFFDSTSHEHNDICSLKYQTIKLISHRITFLYWIQWIKVLKILLMNKTHRSDKFFHTFLRHKDTEQLSYLRSMTSFGRLYIQVSFCQC